jgi:hypothetical protein
MTKSEQRVVTLSALKVAKFALHHVNPGDRAGLDTCLYMLAKPVDLGFT